ncbi:MAG: hypothetical protein U9Q20_02950 [Campylobacterota bacterium]|nr:hypothetical protein [Campylobacterota bacterium]
MAVFYSVRIRSDNYNCTKLKQSGSKIIFQEHMVFDELESLKAFIKNKKNISFILFENQFLKSNIVLNRNISGRSSINSMIFSKLQKEHSNIDVIRFKYSVSDDNPKKDSIKYAIHGLYQDSEAYQTFNKLKTFENTNLITLENYALYSYVKKALPKFTVISVYVDNNKIVITAGDKNELFYSRNEEVASARSMPQEIIKNILFIKQKLRDVKFDAIVINGSIFEDTNLYETIYNQMKIPVASFFPDSSNFQGFTPQTFNETLIDISSFDVDYSLDFTSMFIKSHIQYSKALNVFIPLMILLAGYFGYDTYDKYEAFEKSNQEYNSQVAKFASLSDNLVLNYEDKETLYNLMDILNGENNKVILEQILNIKKNILTLNNSDLGFIFKIDLGDLSFEQKEISSLKFSKNKNFENSNELNRFKKKLQKLQKELDSNIKIIDSYDLNNLTSQIEFVFYGVGK